MCLYIDHSLHPKNTRSRSPHYGVFTAAKDILVWKSLKNANTRAGYAPYRDTPYVFGEMKTVKLEAYFDDMNGRGWVNLGLHACTTPTARATKFCRIYYDAKVYPAVVPKGAKFYLGRNNEIVSDKLTVYADRKELLKAYGATRYGDPVKKSSYRKRGY